MDLKSYKATICQSVPRLNNLTDSEISVYLSDGAIKTYVVKKIKLPDYKSGVFYVVDKQTYEAATKKGRITTDLVAIENISEGRGGVKIASLRLYDDSKVKVYPANNGN